METKASLRTHFQNLRRDYSASAESGAILRNIQKLIGDLAVGDTQVCLYRHRAEEAPCEFKGSLHRFFFPRLNGDELRFFRPESDDAFELSRLKIAEPAPARSRELDPSQPLVVFCPAVAVDLEGTRLGMGRAYYDRFFASYPHGVRVGVCFHVQLASEPLPREAWDEPLDWLVTEKMILCTSQKGVPGHGSRRRN